MGCIPCTNLQPEVAHLNACYPPSKALLTSGPEYRPLSQDLSKLTYFATNKPSKLARIGEELEKRISKESTRSSGGYAKYRASLLISLAILRALLTECKRDISLIGKSALKCINSALDVIVYQRSNELDLEVVGRASAAFIAFTTFTDGSLIGIDENVTRTYLDILQKFGRMATFVEIKEKPDEDKEQENRTRLLGLAGLNGAILSDSLYSSNTEFPKQISILLPPLLINLFERSTSNSIEESKVQSDKIESDYGSSDQSPFFNEFSAKRPLNARRAPSLHAHIPGEKGPTKKDVLRTTLKSFHSLVQQSKISQATMIIDQIIGFLDKDRNTEDGWKDLERCCWLAEKLTAWIILQFRFVVPTRLIEVLIDQQNLKEPTAKNTTILSMVITILNSTTSLVGLGVSDLLGNLITLIIRRIKFDQRDSLLPSLVSCVSALGTHIYYADQINDIVEEISIRIADININDKHRSEIIRVLINCIIGVMITADQGDLKLSNGGSSSNNDSVEVSGGGGGKGKSKSTIPLTPSISENQNTPSLQRIHNKSSRRNSISPEVWQETLPLLCESDYAVRITYARALLLFLETELPRGSSTNNNKSGSDSSIYRFCHALNASIYTLLMSNCLGAGVVDEQSTLPSPEVGTITPSLVPDQHTINTADEQPQKSGKDERDRNGSVSGKEKEKGVSFNLISPTPNSASGNGNSPASGNVTPTGKKGNTRPTRRPSLPLNRLQSYVTLNSFDNVATPLDFSCALTILKEIFEIQPIPSLITSVPMLLALDKDAGNELTRRPNDGRNGSWVLERKRAIRELVCMVWKVVGEKWGVGQIQDIAQKSLVSLPEPYVIPPLPPYAPSSNLDLPETAISFVPHMIEGESSSASKPLLDPKVLLTALTGSSNVQSATGRDEAGLRRRWEVKWSVENAVKDSIERFSSGHVRPEDQEIHNEIANVLMSMNNGSYQSFGNGSATGGHRPGSRTIDVGDLREALGGKVDDLTNNTSSPPSVISSAFLTQEDQSHLSTALQKSLSSKGLSRSANNQDVKEVLKDIFKDKKRSSTNSTNGPHAHRVRTVSAGSGLGQKVTNGDEPELGGRVEGNVHGKGDEGGIVGGKDLNLDLGKVVA
ncbi:hypothetical protein I203_104655 [Kwoniella mangroviensis CBS 8507]|uniref:uncharacterized protein n=1 Tax=Kwoniella mangroviensis CBS 8507 TaxID=1296122 RepID=UPI00080CDFBC|nr:uncharacterized protein I203_00399 [Kwoniella mangroviensis CBS 8507]OCF70267.1 hypothetical protein I203_00399 [Kwoniella mangroviensis CBS 8507]